MASHLLLLLVFALVVSLVLSVIGRNDPREEQRLALLLFAGFVVTAIVLGWLMYPFPV